MSTCSAKRKGSVPSAGLGGSNLLELYLNLKGHSSSENYG